jgi:small subunit ribosomal protein S14
MAKKSMIERELKRQKLVQQYAARRLALKTVAANLDLPMDQRFKAQLKLAGSYYRKLKLSRIMLRDLASFGQIPGMVKSSW